MHLLFTNLITAAIKYHFSLSALVPLSSLLQLLQPILSLSPSLFNCPLHFFFLFHPSLSYFFLFLLFLYIFPILYTSPAITFTTTASLFAPFCSSLYSSFPLLLPLPLFSSSSSSTSPFSHPFLSLIPSPSSSTFSNRLL